MKRKTLTLTLVLLSCLALIGVGFASWIISANTTKELEGNISVDVVTDKRLKVNILGWVNKGENEEEKLDTNVTIQYGYSGTSNVNDWLKVSSDALTEKLTATLRFEVTDATGAAVTGLTFDNKKISATIIPQKKTIDEAETDVYKLLEDASIIGAIPTMNEGTGNDEIDNGIKLEEKNDGIYELTLTFKWGSATETINPYVYFNGKTYGSKISGHEKTVEEEAFELLKKLEDLKNVKFNLKLVIVPAE
ncbi:MAG: hypothetical protein NC182_07885 [Prevotella sp.]|nr:hypothetical protein [Staphylococcus sp.]MCM1351094.1 hypothetical protein [Prevotella sp.]